MLHFSLYGGTHEQIQRNRPDIRPPASPAPQSGGMGADAQNDLQLLEAQFLRGNAPYAPEPESGNVRNHRPVEQYRAVHKARRAFHSGIQKPHVKKSYQKIDRSSIDIPWKFNDWSESAEAGKNLPIDSGYGQFRAMCRDSVSELINEISTHKV